jgi:hypothetical protein
MKTNKSSLTLAGIFLNESIEYSHIERYLDELDFSELYDDLSILSPKNINIIQDFFNVINEDLTEQTENIFSTIFGSSRFPEIVLNHTTQTLPMNGSTLGFQVTNATCEAKGSYQVRGMKTRTIAKKRERDRIVLYVALMRPLKLIGQAEAYKTLRSKKSLSIFVDSIKYFLSHELVHWFQAMHHGLNMSKAERKNIDKLNADINGIGSGSESNSQVWNAYMSMPTEIQAYASQFAYYLHQHGLSSSQLTYRKASQCFETFRKINKKDTNDVLRISAIGVNDIIKTYLCKQYDTNDDVKKKFLKKVYQALVAYEGRGI